MVEQRQCDQSRSCNAPCEQGMTALGGGCEFTAGTQSWLTVNAPDMGKETLPIGWRCQITDASESSLRAYAICAKVQ